MRDVPLRYDVVCTASSYDGALFMDNIEFDYFKKKYSDNLNQCANNSMF